MSISFDCDRCGAPLDKPGALVFGPPGLLATRAVEKLHVCFECWPMIRALIMQFDPRGSVRVGSQEATDG